VVDLPDPGFTYQAERFAAGDVKPDPPDGAQETRRLA